MRCIPLAGLVLCAHPAFAMQVGGQVQVTEERIEFNERVIELTEPVVWGIRNGLDVEIALLEEFDRLLASYPIPGEYMACKGRLAASPEIQTIQMQVLDWPDNPTPEQAQRLSEKLSADMDAFVRKQCGGDILNEWPESRRKEKIEEIEAEAAAAAGPVQPPNGRGRGPAPPDASEDAFTVHGDGPSLDAYRIAKERVQAYCQFKKLRPNIFPAVPDGYNVSVPAKIINPKAGNVYFYFSKEEIAAIDWHCGELVFRVGKATIEMDAIYIRGRTPIKLKR